MELKEILKSPRSEKFKGVLYLDETQNFRKLYLNEKGGNNEFENISFVLGGVGQIKAKPIDYNNLLNILGLKNITEFKYKTLCGSTDFCENLKSIKLNKLFHWINCDKNFVFNLFSLNYAFYLIIDIIDEALLPYEQYDNIDIIDMYLTMHLKLKNALYNAMKPYFNEFVSLLYKYEYPNVPSDKIEKFSLSVIDFVERLQYEDELECENDFATEFLRQILKTMRNRKKFLFLADNEKGEIVADYATYYSSLILKFPNAELIFDEEKQIEPFVKNNVSNKTNYKFVNSKTELLLQVSDVIVGFVSKLVSFVEKYDIVKILEIASKFSNIQKDTLKLFFEIEEYSCNVCEELLQRIQPASNEDKVKSLINMVKLK